MIKDREGFMWFGTWAGINRFDGQNFLTFKSYPGDKSNLKNNRIDQIEEDEAGFLWLRAYDNQIYRFDKRKHRFLAIADIIKGRANPTSQFVKILEAAKNEVWLQSQGEGLVLISSSHLPQPRYNGYSKKQHGGFRLPSDTINFFFRESLTKVWVGTPKGLCLLKKQANGIYKTISFQGKLGSLNITAVDHNRGKVWFGTAEGYLISADKRSGTLTKTRLSLRRINGLLVSKRHPRLYCTTPAGELLEVSLAGGEIQTTQISAGNSLHSLYESSDGALWLEPASMGVIRFDTGSRTYRHFSQKNVSNYLHQTEDYSVFEDAKVRVWVNMKGTGFGYYNPDKGNLEYFYNEPGTANRRFSNMVGARFYDPTGVLWLSTDDGGLEQVIFPNTNFEHHKLVDNSIYRVANEVRAIYQDRQNRLWVSTKDGRLRVFKDGRLVKNLFKNFPSKGFGSIYSILEDRKGNIWLGTKSDGLYKAMPLDNRGISYLITHFSREKMPSLPSNTIYTIIEDKKGRLWAGSYGGGLIKIEEEAGKTVFKNISNTFKKYPKSSFTRIRHLAEDFNGNIWIGTTEGLLIFNPDRRHSKDYDFIKYRKIPGEISSLGGNDVHFILKDSKQRMWVCTSSGGLNQAIGSDPTSALSFVNYSAKNGLPSDYLLSAVEDRQGNLWLSSQNGLTKFNVNSKHFQNFNVYDGLPNANFSEASCLILSNGKLAFGTTAGYITFSPYAIGNKKIKAHMAFTNLQINNRDVQPGDSSLLKSSINSSQELILKHDQNIISIDFSVLDYRSGDKERYIYRLHGFDKSWRNSRKQKTASYTNLPPGKYRFEVKSSSAELYSNVPLKTLSITILPPPWKTWWAYSLYFLTALIMMEVVRRVALTMLRLRQGIAVERRLAELKVDFFTQVSHELRTPLTLILNPTEEILKNEPLSDKGSEYAGIVLKNARRMVRFVNQLLDLRKVESGKAVLKVSEVEICSFVRNVCSYFTELARQKDLSIEVVSSEEELLAWVDGEKLDIAVYNIIGNAVKFSLEKGRVKVVIDRSAGARRFSIKVIDEGPGVSEDELGRIFEKYYEGNRGQNTSKGTGLGLSFTRELIELHQGTISAAHNHPHGLCVEMVLRLGKTHFNPASTYFIDQAELSQLRVDSLIDLPTSPLQNSFLGPGDDAPLVLLVEDSDDLRQFLSSQLSSFYRVETAKDGEEGLQKALQLLPDLVLTDVMMPRIDGIELLDRLKSNISTSHIPVVLLTAKFSVESQIEGLEYGADYYITKPFKVEFVQAAISNLLRQRRRLFDSLADGKNTPVAEGIVITSQDTAFLERIIEIVQEKLADAEFNIELVAETVGMSRSAFFKKFKSLTNMAPVEFVRETRLKHARKLFDAGERNVAEVAYASGFNNPKYFSTCFKAEFNQTPTEYLKQVQSGVGSVVPK
nr:hybrid sensor histidine kinase/response regulator transcription factor [Pedobacter sp. SYSU D00535]